MTPEQLLIANADRAATEFLLDDGMDPIAIVRLSTPEKVEEVSRRVRALVSASSGPRAGGGGEAS